jgi:adenine-specific DNA-methyltransferase
MILFHREQAFWHREHGFCSSGKIVHVRPESMFTLRQNQRSRSRRMRVHVGAEYAFDYEGLNKEIAFIAFNLNLPRATQDMFVKQIDEKAKSKKRQEVEAALEKVQEIESGKIYQNAFEWRFEFPEVLNEQGEFVGFDVVIGNPPYMRVQEIEKTQPLEKTHYEKTYQSAKGSFELANLFFELAVNVSNPLANNAYIFPHKFLNADSGTAFRAYLTQGKYIDKLAHFGANMVFDSADTYTCIAQFSQQTNEGFYFQRFPFKSEFAELISESDKYQFLSYQSIQNAGTLYGANNWILFDNEIGFKAFEKIYEQKASIRTKFERIFQGIATGKDDLYLIEGKEAGGYIEGFFVADSKPAKIEKGLLKPFLKGKDIQRYSALEGGLYIIFPYKIAADGKATLLTEDEIRESYPNGYKVLKEKEDTHRKKDAKTTNNNYWYQYARSQGVSNVEVLKLSSMEICSSKPNVTINYANFYHPTTVYSWVRKQTVTESYKYFLAIANSSLMWWFLKNTGDTLQGDARRFKTNYLNPFPLPESATAEVQAPFIKKVDEVMFAKQAGKETSKLEAEIDALVYDLYGLTQEEIAIVAPTISNSVIVD